VGGGGPLSDKRALLEIALGLEIILEGGFCQSRCLRLCRFWVFLPGFCGLRTYVPKDVVGNPSVFASFGCREWERVRSSIGPVRAGQPLVIRIGFGCVRVGAFCPT
jgi:hypothetical protein